MAISLCCEMLVTLHGRERMKLKITGCHLEFVDNAVDGKISLGCDNFID